MRIIAVHSLCTLVQTTAKQRLTMTLSALALRQRLLLHYTESSTGAHALLANLCYAAVCIILCKLARQGSLSAAAYCRHVALQHDGRLQKSCTIARAISRFFVILHNSSSTAKREEPIQ
eukprot:1107-Heterococcus_DN1.PRE.3